MNEPQATFGGPFAPLETLHLPPYLTAATQPIPTHGGPETTISTTDVSANAQPMHTPKGTQGMRKHWGSCLRCDKEAKTRGLCDPHYRQSRHLVASGRTTWEELESHKCAMPPHHHWLAGRPSNSSKKKRAKKVVAKAQSQNGTHAHILPKVKHGKRLESKCIFPHCKNKGTCGRGLCGVHYHVARKLVKKKRTTWEKLEAMGRCRITRKPRDPMTEAAKWFLGKA
jgi:hypothetical protein